MTESHLSRRRFLQGLGVSAAAVPFILGLDSLYAKAAVPVIPNKRFLFMYTPYTSLYYNARLRLPATDVDISDGSALADPNLLLQPLQANAEHLLVLDRLSLIGARSVYQTAVTSVDHMVHQGESKSMANLLTGQCMIGGDGTFANAGLANGTSLDQVLATQLFAKIVPFPSLEVGVQSSEDFSDRQAEKVVSYDGAGQPRPPMNDPFALFSKLFADKKSAFRAFADKSVLDGVLGDFKRLQPKLSMADRQLLEQHSDAVRRLEQRLTAAGQCVAPTGPAGPSTLNVTDPSATHQWALAPSNFQAVGGMMSDIIVQALACGLTHVVTWMWTANEDNHHYSFLGIDQSQDYGIHGMAAARSPALLTIGQWYASQFNTLLDKLSAIPDSSGSGSLLDNSVLMWASNEGDTSSYQSNNVPVVLAGSNGGYFRSGRSIRFNDVWTPKQWAGPILGAADGLAMTAAWDVVRAGDLATVGTPDLSNNDLCVSILNSFGVETQTFGDPRFCHGPLPGLTA
jgi:hypothetical protein